MQEQLSGAGWVFIVLAWGFILSLNTFCFSNLFKDSKKND